MILNISNLSKSYDNKKILDNINLYLNDNEIISIIGKSGSGKSTLLNIIVGIEKEDSGNIESNGKISYMFQSDALIDYITNINNALIGLKIENKLNNDNIKKAYKYLKKYKLIEYKDNYPKSISGGMRQRLSLIRTLIINPKIILLDEPLSKLDYITKLEIEDDIYKEIKDNNKSGIIVTHDIEEAVSMSDRIYFLNDKSIKKEYKIEKDWINPSDARISSKFRKYVNSILRNMKNEES